MRKKKNKSDKKKKSTSPQKLLIREKLLRFFIKHKTKKYGLYQIIKKLKLKQESLIADQLEYLVTKDKIRVTGNGKYYLNATASESGGAKTYEGYVDMARAGFAYIICQNYDKDVYVSQKNLGSAEDGDYVEISLLKGRFSRPEGKVETILKRCRTQLIGIVRYFNNKAMAFSQSGKKMFEVAIEPNSNVPFEDFDRVIIQITKYKEKPRDQIKGIVIKNLGKESSIDIEMQSIIAEKGFPLDWSKEVMDELQKISEKIELEDYRTDFRNVTTFTIDPFDAKDFDDALSYRRTDDGQHEIGVHIADVSHYVKPGSQLDKSALFRGNSVYLVDRVIPMLPEKLSNELCSLRPLEDKYCFSAVFTFDDDLKLIKQWIGKTLIHSDHRFTYEEAQEILEGKTDKFESELRLLNKIAKHYRKKRMDAGAIDFDSEEVKFRLDEKGNPLSLEIKERKDAHMLVEEFMLMANKHVALHIGAKFKAEQAIPFVYRIHDKPDPEKLENFQSFAKEMDVYLDFSSPKRISRSINQLSELAKEREELKILQPLAIRAMAKAEYSTQNIGHYGLGFSDYTHFTSPIRRYADLMVHRILFDNLNSAVRMDIRQLDRVCVHISNQERKAMDAERLSNRFYQVYYLKDRVGEEFDGHIIGMNDRGFYVELDDTKCEGFLAFELVDQQIALHSSRYKASSGQNTWHFGDRIRVKLEDADLNQKELTLSFIS